MESTRNITVHDENGEEREIFAQLLEADRGEIETVSAIANEVREFVSAAMRESRAHGNDYDDYMREQYQKLFDLLSAKDAFPTVFSTSASHQDKEAEIPEYEHGKDSVYFSSKGGIALRLKAKNLRNGINDVLQPISEKVFYKRGDTIYFSPEIGDDVYEAMSSSFERAIRTGDTTGYEPKLELVNNDVNSLWRYASGLHRGHEVNHIFRK